MNECQRCYDDIKIGEYCNKCEPFAKAHKKNCEIAVRHGLDCYPNPTSRYVEDVDENGNNYGKKSEETWLMDSLWEVVVKLDGEVALASPMVECVENLAKGLVRMDEAGEAPGNIIEQLLIPELKRCQERLQKMMGDIDENQISAREEAD